MKASPLPDPAPSRAEDERAPLRLFLAVCPGPREREALAAQVACWGWDARAQQHVPADWHLTLHFIGAQPAAQLDALAAALAVPLTPFVLSLGEPALWPHGVAVLLPHGVPPALLQLHAQLGERLQAQGLRTDERPYQPHITLARHAQQARLPAAPQPLWEWPVRGYALMASDATPGAPRYRVLRQYGADTALQA